LDINPGMAEMLLMSVGKFWLMNCNLPPVQCLLCRKFIQLSCSLFNFYKFWVQIMTLSLLHFTWLAPSKKSISGLLRYFCISTYYLNNISSIFWASENMVSVLFMISNHC
jgi:hypothetical protein